MKLYLIKRPFQDCYYDETHAMVVAAPSVQDALAHVREAVRDRDHRTYDIEHQWSSDNKKLGITFLGMYELEKAPCTEPVTILSDFRAG